MRIVLCRHGETDFNAEKRYQGRTDTMLNKKGLKQAEQLAEKLGDNDFYKAFSSPLKRCTQTAEKIMELHPKTKLIIKQELIEHDYGVFEGKTPDEIPELFEEKEKNRYEFRHKNGETFREADEKRVKPFLEELKEKYYSRNILVVTHQRIGSLIIGSLLGLPGKEKVEIEIPNDCIYFIDYLPHKTIVKYFLIDSKKQGEGYLKRNSLSN